MTPEQAIARIRLKSQNRASGKYWCDYCGKSTDQCGEKCPVAVLENAVETLKELNKNPED